MGYLPVAGFLGGNSGAPMAVAADGNYWSSDRYPADLVQRVVSIRFSAAAFNAANNPDRGTGCTLRCVQKFARLFYIRLIDYFIGIQLYL